MTYAIIIFLILLLIYVSFKETIDSYIYTRRKCNQLDERCYKVSHKYDETDQASKLLAQLNMFCMKLMRHLRDKYLWNYHPNEEARDLVKYLLSNYNPDGIIENDPKSDVNTSYVDDKGRVFAICLREKISGQNKFHSLHDLEFVVMHEMAHMANVGFGHDKEDFWPIFKFLMQEAEIAKLHKPRNYKQNPMNYCSLHVDYSPYYDESLIPLM